jgi:CHAT domain-containing protein/Tfp pilus assembly protein PilF
VLDAEILTWRGLSKGALSLLDAPISANLADSEIAVRKELVEGLANAFLQRFSEAEQHIAKAEELIHSHPSKLQGETSLARGTLFFLQGNYPSAQTSFHGALQDARQSNEVFLETRAAGSLGLVAMYQEHFDESIDWYTQSLQLSQSLGARIVTEKTLGNMGWCYYRMGDLEKAASFTTEAKDAATQLGAEKEEMLWSGNIGAIEFKQLQFAEAEHDFQRCLALARKLDNKPTQAVSLNNLALVDLKQREYDHAEQNIREALALERSGQDHSLEPLLLITDGYIAIGRGDLHLAQTDFDQVIHNKNSATYLHWQAEAGLGKVFAAENLPADAANSFRSAMKTIEEARLSIHREDLRLSFLSGVSRFYDDYLGFLVSNGKTAQALAVVEASRAQTLAEGLETKSAGSLSTTQFNPQQAAKRLNSLALSYWLGTDQSFLWVVTPQHTALFTLPPGAEIDALVQSYRRALLNPPDVLETRNAAGQKLYDLLVAPAAKIIPKNARVIILPDGSLYGLNFETLLVPSPQLHYWIEDVDVTYASSLNLLAAGAFDHPAESAKKLLLIGDSVSPDAEFPKLPQAAAEIQDVAKYFPGADREVFSGAQATPQAYLDSQPGNFSYIHFVAHGTASRSSPLDSAVILTKQGDSYKLYARDIIQHRLHADLVTISACHGEGVRTYSGEGLVGLSWAFLRAGAHGVIAALWEVNDNSTPQLMDHLYSGIGKGTPPDAALRDAKLALLRSGTIYRRPFYWAPFELYRGS